MAPHLGRDASFGQDDRFGRRPAHRPDASPEIARGEVMAERSTTSLASGADPVEEESRLVANADGAGRASRAIPRCIPSPSPSGGCVPPCRESLLGSARRRHGEAGVERAAHRRPRARPRLDRSPSMQLRAWPSSHWSTPSGPRLQRRRRARGLNRRRIVAPWCGRRDSPCTRSAQSGRAVLALRRHRRRRTRARRRPTGVVTWSAPVAHGTLGSGGHRW